MEIVLKRVFIRTFGCQMNVYDTGKMQALLGKRGYGTTDTMSESDLVIINTCSVREKPENKLHGFLGEALSLKRRTRDRKVTVAVAGCVAQQEGQTLLDRYPAVDLVFGPDAVPNIVDMVEASLKDQVLDTNFLDAADYIFTSDLAPDTGKRVGSFVTIQKGCDNKCTFCIVPATRGPELSRTSVEIVEEVKAVVSKGVQEITLIGQNVNSYGLKVEGELNFAQLLYAVAAVPGVERIRYTTSHPRDMGEDVIQAYRDLPQLTSQLHLPVQSGADRVLRRMKRYYTREHYMNVVNGLFDARPDMALSTDFIIGFPGETEGDFEATMSLLEEVGFDSSFSFKYSPRPGTASLRLPEGDTVPPDVAQRRLEQLQAKQRLISLQKNRALEGQVLDVLIEGRSKHDADVMCGRTSSFKMINFPGDLSQIGQIVPVLVTKAFTNSMRGEAV